MAARRGSFGAGGRRAACDSECRFRSVELSEFLFLRTELTTRRGNLEREFPFSAIDELAGGLFSHWAHLPLNRSSKGPLRAPTPRLATERD
jgi:hypothetical protein